MTGRRKVLSLVHARALIKEASGIIEGDRAIEAEAAAEIAARNPPRSTQDKATSSRAHVARGSS